MNKNTIFSNIKSLLGGKVDPGMRTKKIDILGRNDVMYDTVKGEDGGKCIDCVNYLIYL
jgi:hypothetical protein